MKTRPTPMRFHVPYPAWQHAFSMDALRRAWQPIRANNGVGPDGESVASFEKRLEHNLHTLQAELVKGSYQPKHVKQILVPKGVKDWRPLTLWAIRDKIAQRAVYNYLDPIWDARFLSSSYGFRSGRSRQTAAQAIMAAQEAGAVWVFESDIKDCFGSMKNKRILKLLHQWHTPKPMRLLIQKWLEAEIFNSWRDKQKIAGTSQGGVISPLLCNLYLHALDCSLTKRGWWPVRYADDFVVLAHSKRSVLQAQSRAAQTLGQLGLSMREDKTKVIHMNDGFQFVGWFFVKDQVHQLK